MHIYRYLKKKRYQGSVGIVSIYENISNKSDTIAMKIVNPSLTSKKFPQFPWLSEREIDFFTSLLSKDDSQEYPSCSLISFL